MWLIIFEIFMLLLGFTILIIASDLFVDAISSLASNFKMSKMATAMTVGAFATCAPELAISFSSISAGLGDMALSNVVGSSIVNILLIIGFSALCFPIKVKDSIIKKEALILLGTTVIFAFSMADNVLYNIDNSVLTRVNAVLFIIAFILFMYFVISQIKLKKNILETIKPKYNLWSSIFIAIICIISIIIASNIIVEFSTLIAQSFNVSTKIITMTVIVIGTSLPELSMTIISAKKKEYDIAIGNIIGTNIFNIGIVLGLPILFYGNIYSTQFNMVDILTVLSSAVLFYIFAKSDRKLTRREGFVMFLIFIIYYIYLFFQ